jgi:hypothetical protein
VLSGRPTQKVVQYKIMDKNVTFFAPGNSSAVLWAEKKGILTYLVVEKVYSCPSQTKMRVDRVYEVWWYSYIYVFTSIKYMTVMAKHRVQPKITTSNSHTSTVILTSGSAKTRHSYTQNFIKTSKTVLYKNNYILVKLKWYRNFSKIYTRTLSTNKILI